LGESGPRAQLPGDRWQGRPVLSFLVSAAIFIVPVALSIGAATVTAHLLPRPRGTGWTLGWWATVLVVPTLVLFATERMARRALPLAVLLKMTMVFPDRAPRRFSVARRAGTTRDLARRVDDAKIHGVADEPVLAAEKILALAGALNAHDRLTRGHGERVRAYTDLIADELDLSSSDQDRLRWSALLHDIGKLAVHPHVLNKPDKLSDEEWEVIKRHPLEGAKLTAPLAAWLGEWANTIAEHHEKFDGSGYPYGLAGHDISLGGRIVAVADCYDTMTAIRSYKRPMSPEAARAELAACAGKHFDPKVVRAFLDVSIGRLRPVAGPLSWLGSLPFVSNVPRLGQAVSALGRSGVAAATVAGVVAVGTLQSSVSRSVPHQLDLALGQHQDPGASSGGGALSGGSSANGGVGGKAPGPSGHGASGGSGSGSGASVPGANDSGGGRNTPGGSNTGGTTSGTDPGATTPTPTAPGSTTTTAPGSTTTTVVAGPSSLHITNGGPQAGRPQQGDQIIVTFSAGPAPGAFCSAWSAGSFPDIVDPNLVVNGQHGSGNDKVTLTDTVDCSGGFHFGTIDLGQTGYFSGTSTFGGAGAQCSTAVTTGCSRVHWDGHNTLTITLGKESSGQPTKATSSVAVYTPDPVLGVAGTISSPSEEHF